ncbi:MAG: glycosyltransferase family 39 protein [Sedimentisphaerales bacterium]|nr:glycosyltransferase family 39 protein [Sedimentisphaerales bacterium]
MIERANKKRYTLLIYLMLAVAVITAYEPMRHNDFINYDDTVYVTKNPHITGGLTAKSVIRAFTSPHFYMYHPLTTLSHMLDCELFGLEPFWHHADSLLFHTFSTLLLFWVLKRMTGAVWASAFVAAVFALHPLQVDSVAWVAERKSVLSGFFWILTIAAYIRYAERPRAGRYLLVVIVYILALLSKPVVVTLPFVLLLLDYWPLRRFESKTGKNSGSEKPQYKQFSSKYLVIEKLPLFILSVILSVVTFVAQRGGGAVMSLADRPVKYRLANAFIAYSKYVEKFVWPHKLAIFYPHPDKTVSIVSSVVCALVLLFLTATFIYLGRRKRYLTVGWLWFVGVLVPVIGIVQVGSQKMADRYMYIPVIGLSVIIAWGIQDIAKKLNTTARYIFIHTAHNSSIC